MAGKGTGTSGTTGNTPGPAGPVGLSLVQGRALLTVGQRDLGPALLQEAQVEFPGLKSLPNGGGAAGVRRRRGRLRIASLLVDNASLERRIAETPDKQTGITKLGVALEKGRIVLSGQVATSERSADFKARVTLAAGTGRSLRIGIEDLRVHGAAPPLPLSAIANAALCALLGQPVDTHDGSQPGNAAFELDVLELALDEVFVAEGFRLPDTAGTRLGSVAITAKGVELVWSDRAIPLAKPPAEPEPPKDEVAELRKALAAASRSEQRADLAQQLAAACERVGDEVGAVEALKICIEHAPPGALVGPAWRRLVELHARGGDPHAAARALIASADDARTGASDSERAATLVAASEILRKRLNLRDDASMMLERAVALDPGSAEALEGLEAVSTDAGDHQRLADVLERKVDVVARGPVEQKEILTKLADLYDGPLGQPDRARETHERALRIDPDFPHSRVWLARDAWVRGDAAGALEFVRPVPLSALSDEGLVLRADLGERERILEDALPALEELRARALAAGHSFAAQEIEARIIVLTHPEGVPKLAPAAAASPNEGSTPSTTEELERRLSSNPSDEAAVAELEGRYIAIGDPAHRAEALSGLLRRALGLSAERRKSIYAALGESAEAGGDLESAEQAYWRAASIEAEPTLRANYLVAHARMLMARGDVQTAFSELDAALASAPDHAGAAAVLADLCYRTHDWTRARALYTALETAPDAADVIPRALLVHRRAALARRQGDAAEAEALYRELAILNPAHADARRALAELSRARGDLPAAAQRLEEVLRLVPGEGTGDLVEIRYRLASIYAEMGEWESVRYHLELVVAQDPSRVAPLELLLEAYDRLNVPGAAAEACARLARLHREPTQRAAALYRQAELLRTRLDDPAGALDAYLRSSDLDPTFVPARLRLVDHYWESGDLEVVADLANDLAGLLLSPDEDADLVARLAIASAHPRAGGPSRFPFSEHPALASAAVRALVDVAALSEGRGVDALDPFITRARAWAGPAGQIVLIRMLVDQVVEDPARPAPALALGRFAELAGRLPLAGSAYGLLAFVAPHSPAARHLDSVGPLGAVRPDAVRIGGTIDHPDLAGATRRALARLASPLLGFATEAPAPKPTEGSGLPPSRAAELRRIGDLIGAPPFIVVRDEAAMSKTDDRRRLRVIPTHPAGLMIGSTATALGERAWSFVAGRALETLRSGLRTSGLAGSEGLVRLLEGARAALARTPIDEPQAKAVADWLRTPAAELSLGPDEARATTLVEIESALAALPDWATFARGAQHTRNRIGLLACGRPNEALAILKSEDRDEPYASSRDGRSAFLNRPAARALVRFMFSPEYEEAFS